MEYADPVWEVMEEEVEDLKYFEEVEVNDKVEEVDVSPQ